MTLPVMPIVLPDALAHFPPGYAPRPSQEAAIRAIEAAYAAGKRVAVLEGPTGFGKTHVMMTFARAARAAGGRAFMLSSQKSLQDQYTALWPPPEIEELKGRNAYPCTHDSARRHAVTKQIVDTCDDAPCTRRNCSILSECVVHPHSTKGVVGLGVPPAATKCPYWKQLILANAAPVTLFNFSSFLHQQRLKRFGVRDLILIDEVHGVEGELMRFMELTLSEQQLEVVQLKFAVGMHTAKEVVDWLMRHQVVEKIAAKLEELGTEGEELGRMVELSLEDSVKSGTRELLEKLRFKLDLFMAHFKKTEWVIEMETRPKVGKTLIARPVYAKGYAEELLFSKGARVLAVSATILDKDVWAGNLGLDLRDVEFVQVGSDFPKENRPVIREYVGSMNWADRKETLPKLCAWIRETLLPRHASQRGIVHAHSFDIARAIVDQVASPRLVLHRPGQDKREILARHVARADSVIVAPGMHEGIDLKDDLSRFQVIARVPYPNTRDLVVAERLKHDGGWTWYMWLAAIKLCQSAGRSVRSKTDHAVTYITDSAFEEFLPRAWRFLPVWFREAIQ